MHTRTIVLAALVVPALLLSLGGCREFVDYNSGNIDFEPNRPEIDEPSEPR